MSKPPKDRAAVECVVPAAGAARRMGAVKQTLELDGTSLIVRAVENALAVCRRCIVVTGAAHTEVAALLCAIAEVTVVHNRDYERGMFSSIVVGVSEVTTPAFFVAPADMPFLAPDIYRALLAERDSLGGAYHGEGWSIFPEMDGRRGHPVLISSAVAPRLMSEGSRFTSMRQFLSSYPARTVPTTDDGIFFDIDTPEALNAARNRVRNG